MQMYNTNASSNTTPPTTTPSFSQTPQNIQKANNVRNIYLQVLGRSVTDQDLAYIINSGISEADLTKRMLESEEHAEIVKSRQEVILTRIENEKMKKDYENIKIKADDVEYVNNSLRSLIDEKAITLSDVKEEIRIKDQTIMQLQKDNSLLMRHLRQYKKGWMSKLLNGFGNGN